MFYACSEFGQAYRAAVTAVTMKRNYEQQEKALLSQAGAAAASAPPKVTHEGFDTSVIEVSRDDYSDFIETLLAILLGNSNDELAVPGPAASPAQQQQQQRPATSTATAATVSSSTLPATMSDIQ